jgi:hypothetical protein
MDKKMEVPAHVQRMQEELFGLEERTEKLKAFIKANPIFSTLDEQERIDLVDQSHLMNDYRNILRRRLNRAEFALKPVQTTMAEPCNICDKLDMNDCEKCSKPDERWPFPTGNSK